MFDEFVEQHQDAMIESLQNMLRIKSTRAEAKSGQPFGDGVARALDYITELAGSHGFTVENCDGFAVHVEYGEGDDYVAVLSHLDVVPEGSGWLYGPFDAVIDDGKVYARGAIDDKGPAMSSLWALIALKESGLIPRRKIRLIFGGDEESHWECMDHYFKHHRKPLGGFTPDADFPLIHAEKGLATFVLSIDAETNSMSPQVVEFTGGSRVNMVPDYASVVIDCHSETAAQEWQERLLKDAKQEHINCDVKVDGSTIHLTIYGISAHGSTPDVGENAILGLASLLSRQPVANASMWRTLSGIGTDGTGLGIVCSDAISGALTANLGVGQLSDNTFHFYINVRYPLPENIDGLLGRVRESVSDKWAIEVVENKEPLYVPKDSVLVETLLRVYREYTEDFSEPLAIGGATYARAIPNAVAFGALRPGQADVAHQKDEYWAIDDYLLCTKIYAQAMYELANML